MTASADLLKRLDADILALEPQTILWRRDIHEHPELSNREFRTAALVAEHLKSLGLEVQEQIAHTGVVGLLVGGKPGPVVALRADMDALPVKEEVDVPFASTVVTDYEGERVPVMHACGHDAHTAILLSVATVLSACRDQIAGSIKFIFQPAEEQAPMGEEGGAPLMIKEGALDNPRPEAIFGLHVLSGVPSGHIGYRSGPVMASSDTLKIVVEGCQCHGALPWKGVDPIVVASQVVLGLQTIQSRQMEVTKEPTVITVGAIRGGVRDNIVPDRVELLGTVRAFDEGMRRDLAERIERTATHIALSAGATASVNIYRGYEITINHSGLMERMLPTLKRVAGESKLFEIQKLTGAEDFSYYQKEVPGVFFFVGVTPSDQDMERAASIHSPRFYLDESAMKVGVRALVHLSLDFLNGA